jgi:hypothetical protein
MPINIASCLLKDFLYQQNEKTSYVFENDKFVLVDRDEVADSILKNIDAIFEQYIGKDEQLFIERQYDPIALNQALCRYSRDIFGEKRLHARISHFAEKYNIHENDANELMAYEDYGLKIDSCSPYIHRRIACLFYWFSVCKPFRVTIKSTIPENENIYAYFEYHNEFITYILAMMVLTCVNWTINIHEKLPIFKQFLYDLHYRKLSRSALEFFLSHHINLVPKS